MRLLSSELITALEAEEITSFYMLEILVNEAYYRFTDCDIPLNTGTYAKIEWETGIDWEDGIEWETGYSSEGETYYPRGFSFEAIRYSMKSVVDQFKFEVDNLDQYFSVVFAGQVVMGTPIKFRQVVLNSNRVIIGSPITLFEGQVDAWDLDEARLAMTTTNDFVSWAQQTLARHSASCRWIVFKGTECGYSGGDKWCDRSYTRCQALGNTDNFGGFRFLPGLMDKEIWWGSQQA